MIYKDAVLSMKTLWKDQDLHQCSAIIKLHYRGTGAEYFTLFEGPALEPVLKLLMEAYSEFEILPDVLEIDEGMLSLQETERLVRFIGALGGELVTGLEKRDADFECDCQDLERETNPYRTLAKMKLKYQYHRDLYHIDYDD